MGVLIILLAAAAAAGAADYEVARPAGPPATNEPPASDATLELKWDNGVPLAHHVNETGAGYWFGNDWDLSTISDYRVISMIKIYSLEDWPNAQWDGLRLGIYAFAGGAPGSLLWGPKYFKATRAGDGWCGYSVGWTLPAGNKAFVAAAEQYYDPPNADSFAVDIERTFWGHSWERQTGRWEKLKPFVSGFRNLMLRVVVNNAPGVAPTSLGRVKALYY
jgi:hypothetical protein